MAANLIEDLGPDYCNQMVHGALFQMNGEAYEFIEVTSIKKQYFVRCLHFKGTVEKLEVDYAVIPASAFVGWKSLSFPTLGYRQAAAGQVLAYVSRNNSVRRGLNKGDLLVEVHDVTHTCQDVFGLDTRYFTRGHALSMLVCKPSFTSLGQGMQEILAGHIPSFALSADFAVAPGTDSEFLEVLYRQRRVGTVDEAGNIALTVPDVCASWSRLTNK